MQIIYSPEELQGGIPYPVATVGNFDGVHLGHARILETVRARANAHQGTVLLITFNPHPQKVLHPDMAPSLIATRQQKHQLLELAGVDVVVELPFTRELAALTPELFVHSTLLHGLHVKEVHIGRNFRFGRDRAGDFQTLERLGQEHGFTVHAVEGVRCEGDRISSSRVRRALAAGDVSLATNLLGHEPELVGVVCHGDRRGRALGFPTANLEVANEMIPLTGVYATRAVVEGREWGSVTNIGSRPTFPGAGGAVESHLLDFHGDLYEQEVRLRFVQRLRDEARFSGIDALTAQIAEDVRQARRRLGP